MGKENYNLHTSKKNSVPHLTFSTLSYYKIVLELYAIGTEI